MPSSVNNNAIILTAQAATPAVTILPSSYTLTNGTLSAGSVANLATYDDTHMNFTESDATYAGDELIWDHGSEDDDASEFTYVGDCDAHTSETASPYSGTYYQEFTSNGTGTINVIWDNGTTLAAGMDLSLATIGNTSLSSNTETGIYDRISMHNSPTVYAYIDVNTALTDTWTPFEYTTAALTVVGGFNPIAQSVNYINLTFSNLGNNKEIYLDAMFSRGNEAGETNRKLTMTYDFTGIPQGYDDYELQYSAQYIRQESPESNYTNGFWTDSLAGWSNTTNNIVISQDAVSDGDNEGDYAIKFVYDDLDNSTIIFDNGTSQDMQLDISNYDTMYFQWWADNANFAAQGIRFYTNATNYYYINVAGNTTTTRTSAIMLFSYFTAYGSPSWTNVSWFEIYFNNTHAVGETTVWLDRAYFGTIDNIRVVTPSGLYEDLTASDECGNYTITLDNDQVADGEVTITIVDLLSAPDYVNSKIIFDKMIIAVSTPSSTSGGGSPQKEETTTTIPLVEQLFEDPIINPLTISLAVGFLGVTSLLLITNKVLVARGMSFSWRKITPPKINFKIPKIKFGLQPKSVSLRKNTRRKRKKKSSFLGISLPKIRFPKRRKLQKNMSKQLKRLW